MATGKELGAAEAEPGRVAGVERMMKRYRPRCLGLGRRGAVFAGSDDFNRLQGGFLPLRGEGVGD
ncbi:MAG: hypothetical protein ABSA66_04490 [Roseiarcus sp.]|jgi:hypothetical protein